MELAKGYDGFVRKPVKEDLIFEKFSQHLGIVCVYEDTPIQAELSQSTSSLTVEALAVMLCEWFDQLNETATIAQATPILALISSIPQQEHLLSAELKRMVNRYQFESIIHLVEAVSQL